MSHWKTILSATAFCVMTLSALVACSDDEKPVTTEDLNTTVSIDGSYESSAAEVTLVVNFEAVSAPNEAGIVYSYTEAIPSLSNATKSRGTIDGDAFSVKLAGLKPSRTYYYRAYFLNGDTYTYSDVLTFRTADDEKALVTTLQPNRLLSFVATLGGQTTIASNAKSVGIEFSTSSLMTPAQTLTSELQGDKFYATVKGVFPDTLYYYRAFVITKDGNKKYGETLTLKPREQSDVVDLGLKTLWSSKNFGAETLTNYGKYTAWGFLGNPEEEDATFNNCPEGYAAGAEPPTSICATKYDIVTKTLGEGYRLPTQTDINALQDSCAWELITMRSGHVGYVVTSLKNDNSIFIPFSGKADYVSGKWTFSVRNTEGNYWTGSLDQTTTESGWKYAYSLHVSLKGKSTSHTVRPSYISIRPVADRK